MVPTFNEYMYLHSSVVIHNNQKFKYQYIRREKLTENLNLFRKSKLNHPICVYIGKLYTQAGLLIKNLLYFMVPLIRYITGCSKNISLILKFNKKNK